MGGKVLLRGAAEGADDGRHGRSVRDTDGVCVQTATPNSAQKTPPFSDQSHTQVVGQTAERIAPDARHGQLFHQRPCRGLLGFPPDHLSNFGPHQITLKRPRPYQSKSPLGASYKSFLDKSRLSMSCRPRMLTISTVPSTMR